MATDPFVFKNQNRAMQEIARELDLVRNHNKAFKDGDPQHDLLLHAEAGLVCTALEHFVRVVVGPLAPPEATLFNLLQVAASRKLLRVPWADQSDGIKKICDVRNSLMHANFAQAAKDSGKASVEEYFKTVFASELEGLFRVLDDLMKQIDIGTGKPIGVHR